MEAKSVIQLKGVGEAVRSKLSKLGINTQEELVAHVPFRYDDYSHVVRVSQIRPGPVTIKVKLHSVKSRYSKRGLHITEAMASDDSGSVKLIWFNQPYRSSSIKSEKEYFVSGDFASDHRYFAISNPACELVNNFPVNTARLVPIYRLTKGLGATQLRKLMRTVLQTYKPLETLPKWLVEEEGLISKADALTQMHFPESTKRLAEAKYRLGFEEIFELTLASEINKREFKQEHSLQIPFNEGLIKEFVRSLPYKLTNDQRRAAWEVFQDMSKGRPMNRLVEGDVGSGKTVVAALAAIGVIDAGFQVAFMAPTELLAKQHAESLRKLLKPIGLDNRVVLFSGNMGSTKRKLALNTVKSVQAGLVIGTHALFQDKVEFHNLGLIIVDEQHRFGVEQRKKLQSKASVMPHVLNLTATPIPRSLALTLFGEMDVSIIQSMPKGRKPIKTLIEIPENRGKVYKAVAKDLDSGKQAFVVTPMIEENDDTKRLSAKTVFLELHKKVLKKYKIGLLHGKMKSDEKDEVMQRFLDKKLDVLVSTTVIEVGVDVPNASVMVVEGADSFGLAQLHQLRGRVGRGKHESSCYLVLSSNDEPKTRLKVLEHERNGFKLAEYDLKLRGPGAIYGTLQHGELDLRVAKLTDIKLINSARSAAEEFVLKGENLLKYPDLNRRVSALRTINNLN